jgi:ABC-type polysaccharide/polyol phosphate export permease
MNTLDKKLAFSTNYLWHFELINVLVKRYLKRRYRGSFLGIYWSLLNPLMMTFVYTLVFGTNFKQYYDNSILNYVLAAFTGLTIINFFSSSTLQALISIVENGSLLNKIRLPLFIFPFSIIGANVFQLVMGAFPLLAIVTAISSKNLINVIALIFPLFALVLICLGIGLATSTLYVFFRDLPYFYEILTFVMWITSPIFYPRDIVPENISRFLKLNPLSPIIESLRQISLSGDMPEVGLIFHAFLSGLIMLTCGFIIFRLYQHKLMDLL